MLYIETLKLIDDPDAYDATASCLFCDRVITASRVLGNQNISITRSRGGRPSSGMVSTWWLVTICHAWQLHTVCNRLLSVVSVFGQFLVLFCAVLVGDGFVCCQRGWWAAGWGRWGYGSIPTLRDTTRGKIWVSNSQSSWSNLKTGDRIFFPEKKMRFRQQLDLYL